MVSEFRHYIFGCFDALPKNIISLIKIHQLMLLEEMPKNFLHINTCQKQIY